MREYDGLDDAVRLLRVTAFTPKQLRVSQTRLWTLWRDASEPDVLLPLLRVGRGWAAVLLLYPQMWVARHNLRRSASRPVVYLIGHHAARIGFLASRILGYAPVVIRQQTELPTGGRSRARCLGAVKKADLVITVSAGVRQQLLDAGVPQSKVVVRAAAVNPRFVREPRVDRTGRETRRLAFVGRLEPEKGPIDALEAFELCSRRFGGLSLTIVGSGSLERELLSRISSSDASEQISMRPRLDQETLIRVLDDIDIVLMPSRHEGFGRVALESLLRGCVVVGYSVGGLMEACGPGGVLVERPTSGDLAAAVLPLLHDPTLMESLRTAGERYARQVVETTEVRVDSLIEAHIS